MAKTDTRVLTAHVPIPLAEKVDQMAARLERSRGWIMKQALSAWIEQEEDRTRLTREGTAKSRVPGRLEDDILVELIKHDFRPSRPSQQYQGGLWCLNPALDQLR